MNNVKSNTKLSAGEVIVLTNGEYSSFGIAGYIVSRIDFDLQEAIDLFNQQLTEAERDDIDDPHTKFIAWLVSTERVVPVEHREIHIGNYDELEIT